MKILIYSLLYLSFSSCSKDYSLEDYLADSKLVIVSLPTGGKKVTAEIYLTNKKDGQIFGTEIHSLPNLNPVLKINSAVENLKPVFYSSSDKIKHYQSENLIPVTGDTLQLILDYQGVTYQTETVIPEPCSFDSIRVESIINKNNNLKLTGFFWGDFLKSNYLVEFHFDLQNPSGVKFTESSSLMLTPSGDGAIPFTIDILNDFNLSIKKGYCKIWKVNNDYVTFYTALQSIKSSSSTNSMFSVNIASLPSFIKGGYGIFTGMSSDSISVRISK
ncbi:MAG: hypothetical protein LCH54_12730 [Bacteroidetes bacterium]|nr:hypothetical protein [Bacteroidota bacterium]